MSKRGSRFARRALFAAALASVRRNRNGVPLNYVLREYYENKCKTKAKKVALGAVMHKLTNIVFAVLRDEKNFEIRTPEQHCKEFERSHLLLEDVA